MDVVVVHTSDLAAADLAEVRDLLDVAFAQSGGFDEDDWRHCLGGLHALVRVDGLLVAHGALVQRRLLHGDAVLRAGYVEGVAVRDGHRRRGHADRVMAALEHRAARAHDVAALSTTEDGDPFYASRGWLPWRGPTSALTPAGLVRTPDDDDAVRVLPLRAALDLEGPLACDWREGDAW